MKFSSVMRVLLVEKALTKKINPDTNKPYEIPYARCILLDDAGEVVTVGRLKIPRHLEGKVVEGTFRADFALVVPDYGLDKGDIVAQLTGLTAYVAAPAANQPAVKKAA